jgi:hypothetical protein
MSARKYSDDGESKARHGGITRFLVIRSFILEKTGPCSTQSSFVVSIGHVVNTKDRWMSQGLFRMVSTISAYCTKQDGEQERADRYVAAYA